MPTPLTTAQLSSLWRDTVPPGAHYASAEHVVAFGNAVQRYCLGPQVSSPSANTAAPLSTLQLSRRVYNALRRFGYSTVAELRLATDRELLSVKGLGPLGVDEIRRRLWDYVARRLSH
jgi:DNA-directed RNA polymerase alpha subunit